MKTLHTQGEWTYSASGNNGAEFEVHNGHSNIAIVSDYGPKHDLERAESNAKLIAAAPKMLKNLMLTYLKLQIISRTSIDFGIKTDGIRARLRDQISESTGLKDQYVQEWFEQKAINCKLETAWKIIEQAH